MPEILIEISKKYKGLNHHLRLHNFFKIYYLCAKPHHMLKAGVLGAGHLGKIHLKLLNQSSRYELIGFYDADTKASAAIRKEFGYKSFLI